MMCTESCIHRTKDNLAAYMVRGCEGVDPRLPGSRPSRLGTVDECNVKYRTLIAVVD